VNSGTDDLRGLDADGEKEDNRGGKMEALTYALYAYKLSRFGYRIYLKRPSIRLYRRYYAWRYRPPTAEETERAAIRVVAFSDDG
jgi:hypothetical protein